MPTSEPTLPAVWTRHAPSAFLAVAASLSMAWWTWLTWPDAIVDFGRELYNPWRLASGEQLYRDIACFNGPLSPYLNAALFELFGVGYRTLVWANLALVTAVAVGVGVMARRVVGPLAAALAAVSVPLVFGFHSYTSGGNFNWMAPYSHELTHGVALAMLATALLSRSVECGSAGLALAGGLAAGLALLTKVEVGAAVLGVAAASVVLRLAPGAPCPEARARSLLGLVVGTLLPPILAFFALSLAMSPAEAARGTLGSWYHVANAAVVDIPFFQRSSGMDAPWSNALVAARWCLRYAALAVAALAVAWAVPRGRASWAGVALGIVFAGGLWSWLAWPGLPAAVTLAELPRWLEHLGRALGLRQSARGWPLVLAGLALALSGIAVRRSGPRRIDVAWLAPRLLPVLLALLLLAKIALNTRIWHYGFALALPAGVVLVAAASEGLGSAARSLRGSVPTAGVVALTLWAFWIALLLGQNARGLERRFVWAASGSDAYRSDVRGEWVRAAVSWLHENSSPDETLTVMPGGEMLGYLARRDNPSRYGNFIPPSLSLFGEEAMLADLRARPPDWIALVHRDTSVFGPRFFGVDYGQSIRAWVDAHYEVAQRFGAPVFNDRLLMGIELRSRKQ